MKLIWKTGISQQSFANKGPFQSRESKRANTSLPLKLASNIKNKNGICCSKRSHCGPFSSIINYLHLVRRQNTINTDMSSSAQRQKPAVWEPAVCHVRQFWEVIILNHFDDTLWIRHFRMNKTTEAACALVYWLVLSCRPMICWSKIRLRDSFVKCVSILCAFLLIGKKKNHLNAYPIYRIYAHTDNSI